MSESTDSTSDRIGLRSATLKSAASTATLGSAFLTSLGTKASTLRVRECDEPLRNTIIGGEFEQQLRKWAHHNRLPQWAIHALAQHIYAEVNRRAHIGSKRNVTPRAMPWNWIRMCTTYDEKSRKLRNGAIPFPVPETSVNLPQRQPQQPFNIDDEMTLMDTGEALMTDDLVKEIMNDNDPYWIRRSLDPEYYSKFGAKEKCGAAGVSPWLYLDNLKARNPLFDQTHLHYHTVRSIALVGHKPGDPKPGPTKLSTKQSFGFGRTNIMTHYDPKVVRVVTQLNATLRGVSKVETVEFCDYNRHL